MPPEIVADNATAVAETPSAATTAMGAMERAEAAASSTADQAAPAPGAAAGTPPPASGTPAAGTPAAAIVQPGAGDEKVTGPVPADRHMAAVKNARDKGKEEGAAEANAKYGWLQGVDEKGARTAFGIASQLLSDPLSFVQRLAGELGLTVAKAGAPKTEEEEAFPTADLVGDGGVKAYSEAAVLKIIDINNRKLEAKLNGTLKPVLDARQKQKDDEDRAAVVSDAKATIDAALTEARKLPHFTKENEPAILTVLQGIPVEQRKQMGVVGALYYAYNLFLKDKVFPTIDTAAEERVRDSFKKKAAASVGATPGASGAAVTKTPLNNVTQLAKHMADMEAAGSV